MATPIREGLQNLPKGFRALYTDDPLTGCATIEVLFQEIWRTSLIEGATCPEDKVPSIGVAYDSLEAWAEEHEYKLVGVSTDYNRIFTRENIDSVPIGSSHVPYMFYVGPESTICANWRTWHRLPAYHCHDCQQQHPAETVVCPETNHLMWCPNCGRSGNRVFYELNSRGQIRNGCCQDCGIACGHQGCTHMMPDYEEWRFCGEHAQHAECSNCGMLMEWVWEDPQPAMMSDRHGTPVGVVCSDCEDRLCPNCNTIDAEGLDPTTPLVTSEFADVGLVCHRCTRALRLGLIETADETENPTLERMPTIPGRESIRLCGIELEGGNGTMNGTYLARHLHRMGLAEYPEMAGYNQGDGRSRFCVVEQDSSVDWELVMGPINMAEARDVRNLNDTLQQVREMVHAGALKLDLRAGVHIHVSADRVGLPQAFNLSHIFTYLEDPLFRIAAAFWPFHRACQGNNGARPAPKFTRKVDFMQNRGGRGGSHDDHYYALSFLNYFRAFTSGCSCGAAANSFYDECTCPLHKCTFEFRLFNTTANPRKMHAYLALCQALVAKAIEIPEIKNPNTAFPGLAFNRQPVKGMDPRDQVELVDAWQPRLDFIMTELPLTVDERQSLLYCIRNCEIGMMLSEERMGQLEEMSRREREVVA